MKMDRIQRVARGVALFVQGVDSDHKVIPWEELEDEDRDDAVLIASALVDIVDALREPPRPSSRVRHGRTI